MMTKLNELKAAYEAATPGEWWEDDDGFVAAGHGDSYRTVADARCDVAPFSDANTEFIALAHNMMPNLLEAVEHLEGILAWAKKNNVVLGCVDNHEQAQETMEKLK